MKKILAFAPFLLLAMIVNAQKLPNVQEKSVRAPAGAKIDGKLTEWENLMQAHNAATNVMYVISNDDENLYLVFYTWAAKISKGGLTFEIYRNGKRDKKNVVAITYPYFPKDKQPVYSWFKGEPQTAGRLDTLSRANTDTLIAKAKWINVHGIAGVDTLLSIYNTDGIRAAGKFAGYYDLRCELSISLKNLGLSTSPASTFAYRIVSNPIPPPKRPIQLTDEVRVFKNGQASTLTGAEAASFNEKIMAPYVTLDFWGEYTLALKP